MAGNNVAQIRDNKMDNRMDEATRIVKDYLSLVGQKIPQQDVKRFLEICKAFNLNPFKREIYLIPRGDGASIIVGYETYLKRAERSGKLDGWRVWTEGSMKDGTLKACIEIKRKDWSQPFYHEVYFNEYRQDTHIWRTKPITMIKKVAIAQGFRLAFPEELGGMPYTQDEVDVEKEEQVSVEVIRDENQSGSNNREPEQTQQSPTITIDEIARIIKPELKELMKQRKMTTKEVINFWIEYNGDQDRMIEVLRDR